MGASGIINADGITITGSTLTFNDAAQLNSTEWIYFENNTWTDTGGIFTNKAGDGANTGRQADQTGAFYEYEVEATQAAGFTEAAFLTDHRSNATRIKGSISIGNFRCIVGCSATGTFLLDTNGDITGSNDIEVACVNGATVTWNRATAISLTSFFRNRATSVDSFIFFVRDFLNCASVRAANEEGVGTATFVWESGTLKCKSLLLDEGSDTCIMDLATNNPSIECGDGDFNLNSGGGSTTWQKGTGTITFNGTAAATYDINLAGQTVEDIVVNAGASTKYQVITSNGTTDSLTITAGELDIPSVALTVLGNTSVANGATLDVGGALYCTGDLTFATGSVLQIGLSDDIIMQGGNLTFPNSKVLEFSYRGEWFFQADCTVENPNILNIWDDIVIDPGVTVTCGTYCYFTASNNSPVSRINGILDMGAFGCRLGASAEFTLGSGGDLQGSATLSFRVLASVAWTWDRATAVTMTGICACITRNSQEHVLVAEDLSNAERITISADGSDGDFVLVGTTMKTKKLDCTEGTGESIEVKNTNDKNLETGEVDLAIAGGGTFTWTRSATATWTLNLGNGDIDFDGQTVEAIIINSTGTKTFISGFTTAAWTGTAGTVDMDSKAVTIEGAISNACIINNGGAITQTGAGVNVDWNGETLGNLIVNSAGVQTLTGDVGCADLTLTAGTLSGSQTITASGDVSVAAAFTEITAGEIKMTGTSKTLTTNEENLYDLNIHTGATVTAVGSLLPNDLTVNGTLTLDKTAASQQVANDITGSGTLASPDATIIFVYYDGTATFSGTLTNVVLVKNPTGIKYNKNLTTLNIANDLTL
jgi:hypothetical protein